MKKSSIGTYIMLVPYVNINILIQIIIYICHGCYGRLAHISLYLLSVIIIDTTIYPMRLRLCAYIYLPKEGKAIIYN